MPATKRSSSASAPTAPHQATEAGTRAAATASSASGRRTPSGAASTVGTPKSVIACLDPLGSASLDIPATTNTRASSRRARSRAVSTSVVLPYAVGEGDPPRPPRLGVSTLDTACYGQPRPHWQSTATGSQEPGYSYPGWQHKNSYGHPAPQGIAHILCGGCVVL